MGVCTHTLTHLHTQPELITWSTPKSNTTELKKDNIRQLLGTQLKHIQSNHACLQDLTTIRYQGGPDLDLITHLAKPWGNTPERCLNHGKEAPNNKCWISRWIDELRSSSQGPGSVLWGADLEEKDATCMCLAFLSQSTWRGEKRCKKGRRDTKQRPKGNLPGDGAHCYQGCFCCHDAHI